MALKQAVVVAEAEGGAHGGVECRMQRALQPLLGLESNQCHPARRPGPGEWSPAPCTRGDGPEHQAQVLAALHCCPHTRGWSRHESNAPRTVSLLPARGDDPIAGFNCSYLPLCSPQARDGPDRAKPGDIVINCSPHARGWPRPHLGADEAAELLPVRAGMVPRAMRRSA